MASSDRQKMHDPCRHKSNTGLCWIAVAAILWSVQGVLGKSNPWNSLSLVAVRSVFAAVTLGICRHSFRLPKGKNNVFAAFFVAATGLLFLAANNLTTAANAVVLQYVMPVFVILTGWIVWHKKPSGRDIVCCAVMLAGVVMCFLGGVSGGSLIGNILALLSAGTFAGVYLSAGSKDCDVPGYAYLGALFSACLLPAVFFDRTFSLSLPGMVSAAGMGICVGLGYSCFACGFRKNADPVTASVISYLEPVLNPVWVALFLGEKVDTVSGIGILTVLITAVIYSVLSKKHSEKSSALQGDFK